MATRPAPRQVGGSAACQFYQLGFYVTRSFLCFLLGLQERSVPSFPFPFAHIQFNGGCSCTAEFLP